MNHAKQRRTAQSGVALIEVMIAILVLSFGLLALSGLQTAMVRAQSAAKFRAEAVNLGQDLLGLVWADRPNIAKYDKSACAAYPKCAEWMTRVGSTLPAGSAEVSASSSGAISLTVTWAVGTEGKHSHAIETTVAY